MAKTTKFRLNPEPPLPAHRLEILLEEEEIRNRITEMSRDVREVLGNKDPIFVCVLKGAFMFPLGLGLGCPIPFPVYRAIPNRYPP